jgi:hypothetical protein
MTTWLTDLLTAWAGADWRDASEALGYPSVSPSFKSAVSAGQATDLYEYSPEEVTAICEAVEWLAHHHTAEYGALCRRYRPWQFGRPQRDDGPLLDLALTRLAKKVKELL